MNPINNPFAPGAGSPPPELAGRDKIRDKMRICLSRLKIGKPAKSTILVGLRGVGKTVLLDTIMREAEKEMFLAIRIEAPEGRSLPAMLSPHLRVTLLRLSRIEGAKESAKVALQALAGFVKGLKVTFNDIEVGLDYEPEVGLADNGFLEGDLTILLERVGYAARDAKTVVVIFIDELQYVAEDQLAALISALHRCTQEQLPILMVGAGLPQLRGKMGNAKSYSERLFDFSDVGALDDSAARQAIVKPVEAEGAKITENALHCLLQHTHGYPYFLQEWGKHVWDIAADNLIKEGDVILATEGVIASLDESFFRVRFDRLTPAEKKYLRAMADLGAGPHRSGDIALILKRSSSSISPTRASLMEKGMVWSPSYGETAFTVPLFDEFMKRVMP